MAGAGDVNSDGIDDLIVGAPARYFDRRGSAYVLFGGTASSTVDLASLGERGFKIAGATASEDFGSAVAGGGDTNGDGRDDLLVGAPGASVGGLDRSGSAVIVFGRDETSTVSIRSLEGSGYRISGATPFDATGTSVSVVGDINNDGRDEAVLGAPFASNNGRTESGSVYVVPGKTSDSSVYVGKLRKGYRVDGESKFDFFGWSVSALPDVNGDARDDVIGGAPEAGHRSRAASGTAYIVLAPPRS